MQTQSWQGAFDKRSDLVSYGDNALGLFALALRFSLDDLETTAADSIMDGSDDKKCDILFFDKSEGIAVIAQCYICRGARKKEAPANKASDLNTAVTWLLQSDIKKLPERLRSSAQQLREGLSGGEITSLHVWYVHNLLESKNVQKELETVEKTAASAIESNFQGKKIDIRGLEVGVGTLEKWYADTQSQILVSDEFDIKVEDGYEISGPKWRAYITSVPATFLHKVYKKYRTKLFSANVREYLGSRRSDSNINYGIKNTVEKEPDDFWVFNNGLTVLVNNYEIQEGNKKYILKVSGLSIVNGAQTTGAIGSLKKLPDNNARVPIRFVKTDNAALVLSIVQYNNSQNKITASDFRSTDAIQRRLKEQFQKIPQAEYTGGRRGSFADAIVRRPNLLPSYTVGQALAAFHGDPIVAYNQKTEIWVSDKLYSKYFDDTSAVHIVLAYGLLRSVEGKKLQLVNKAKKSETSLTEVERKQLNFLRKRGSTYLLVAAISSCLETFRGGRLPNMFRLSFGEKTSPIEAQKLWNSIVEVTASFCEQLEPAISDGLKNAEKVSSAIRTFSSLVQATSAANSSIYKQFTSHTKVN